MPYVDNQDMKERATRFGTGGFAAIIYAVVTTICLYKNAYGIMTVLLPQQRLASYITSVRTHRRVRRTITARIRRRIRIR